MANDLSILISGILNTNATKTNIASQIKEIEQSLKPLNLKVNLGNINISQLQNQINKINQATQSIKQPRFNFNQMTPELAKFQAQIASIERSLSTTGRNVKSDWNELGRVTMQVTNQSTGLIEKYKYQWDAVRQSLVRVNRQQVDNMLSIDQLSTKYKGMMSTLTQGKLGKFINSNELKALENSLKNLSVVDGKITTDLQNRFNALKQNAQQAYDKNKQIADESARAYKLQIAEQTRLNRLKEQKSNQNLNEELRAYRLKNQEAARLIANEKKLELARRDAQNNANRLSGQYSGLYDTGRLQAYLNAVEKLKPSTKNLSHRLQLLNRDFNSIKTDALNRGLSTANKNAISLGEAFKTAFTKFPIWLISGSVIFSGINFFKDGIHWVNEFNKSLTELSIVYMKNQEYVEGLGTKIRQLGSEMGLASEDLAKGMAEFARQGLTQEEAFKRMETTSKYAAISNLNFSESAKIMTAAINSMGVTAERAADVWAYMGDATATGKFVPPILVII